MKMLLERQEMLEEWIGNLLHPKRINLPAVKSLLAVEYLLKKLYYLVHSNNCNSDSSTQLY